MSFSDTTSANMVPIIPTAYVTDATTISSNHFWDKCEGEPKPFYPRLGKKKEDPLHKKLCNKVNVEYQKHGMRLMPKINRCRLAISKRNDGKNDRYGFKRRE